MAAHPDATLRATHPPSTGADAFVVGSGPNGLVAVITLARAGWPATVIEAADHIGGGLRSEPLTCPGFVHDVCSAVHPLAVRATCLGAYLPLLDHGVRWCLPDVAFAHPLDGGRAAALSGTVDDTATRPRRRRRASRR